MKNRNKVSLGNINGIQQGLEFFNTPLLISNLFDSWIAKAYFIEVF